MIKAVSDQEFNQLRAGTSGLMQPCFFNCLEESADKESSFLKTKISDCCVSECSPLTWGFYKLSILSEHLKELSK